MQTKYIITTGGVLSGLGKGIVSSSIGKILQCYGFKVNMVKVDPYLNVDAGTMNPFEHGEVFVLDDGGEVDMDLGNYERFLNLNLERKNNITTGKVYKAVIDKERKGDYLGKTVQIIPHVIDEIKNQIKAVSKGTDFVIVEIGGTVGDIESMPFLEAARQLHREAGPENVLFLHVTLVPEISVVGEQKTKPTQHSIQRLQEAGVQPDFILARSPNKLLKKTKEKISLFCNVDEKYIISDPDVSNLYEVPLVLQEERIGEKILKKLGLKKRKNDFKSWKKVVQDMNNAKKTVKIAMAGKYTALNDSYVSITESLKHAAGANNCKVEIKWLEMTDFENDPKKLKVLDDIDGLIVPGGFGGRGVEGKIAAINYARKNKIPFLGLCYGFQLASVGFARDAAGLKGANSTEVDPKTKHPVIFILPTQYKGIDMGATMRLGTWPCRLKKGTLAHSIYNKDRIDERHRHRYEFNPKYVKTLEKAGLVFSGRSPDGEIMEILELPKKEHPFFIASQFHPEFKSRVEKPAPLFKSFIKACLG
ncbi:MAG: CTP synthase [archaeon]